MLRAVLNKSWKQLYSQLTPISKSCGGARGVVVIAVGNEHDETSSNPGRY